MGSINRSVIKDTKKDTDKEILGKEGVEVGIGRELPCLPWEPAHPRASTHLATGAL